MANDKKSNKNNKRLTIGTVVTIISILAVISIAKDGLDLLTEYVFPSSDIPPEVAANSTFQTRIPSTPTIKPTITVQNTITADVLVEPIRLTEQAGNEIQPSFSDNGQLIVFTADGEGKIDIFTMHADGLIRKRRTDNGFGEDLPTFSPDGNKILFGAAHEGNEEIYLLDLDGSQNVTNISNNADSDEGRPRFSSDGKKIIFDSNRTGNWEIFIAEFRNNSLEYPRQLTDRSNYQDRYPIMPMFGNRIYFRAGAVSEDLAVKSSLYAVDADSLKLQAITNGPNDRYPSVTGDGEWIVFSSDRDGNFELYAMHIESGKVKRLTHHPADDSFPSFSKDGRWIVFASNRGGTGYDIYKIPFSAIK